MTEHVEMDSETEGVLNNLPRMTPNRYPRTNPNAWVYINSIGDLCILLIDGGLLMVHEEDLDYVYGSGEAFT